MVYVSTCVGYDDNNDFELREIYVGSEKSTFILKKNSGYRPYEVKSSFFDIVKAGQFVLASDFGPGPVRQINDRDEKSLAEYIKMKIDSVDMNSDSAEKVLFDVLSNFGSAYVVI